MVDEADRCLTAIDSDATHNVWCLVPRTNISKGITINNTIVLHLKSGYGIYFIYHIVMNLRYAHSFHLTNALFEYTIDVGSQKSFILCEQGISTTAS